MSIGESVMRESTIRLARIRRSSSQGDGLFTRALRWGAWFNYLISVVALATGIAAGWRFADIGFDLMMGNMSGEEVQVQAIRKIPAWIFAYKGLKTW